MGCTYEELAGAVAAAHERPAGDVQKAELLGTRLPCGKLVGRDVLGHLHVALGRAHVLPERDDIHAVRAQVVQRLLDLGVRLAAAEHDAGLGHQVRAHVLCMLQRRETLAVRRAPVAHERRRALDRLDVVCVHVEAAARHLLDTLERAAKVGHERLDEDVLRLVLDFLDRRGNVCGAAVREFVAVDGREHNVAEAPPRDGLRRVLRLVGVEGRRRARRLHSTEAARTRAGVAHEHDRRGGGLLAAGAAPALAQVRAPRFLAHGREAEATQVPLDARKVGALRDLRLGVRRKARLVHAAHLDTRWRTDELIDRLCVFGEALPQCIEARSRRCLQPVGACVHRACAHSRQRRRPRNHSHGGGRGHHVVCSQRAAGGAALLHRRWRLTQARRRGYRPCRALRP